jgi:Flp pilus assembly protein TadD
LKRSRARLSAAVPASSDPARALRRWTWAVAALALVVRAIVLAQLHDHPLLQPAGVLDDAAYFRLAVRAAQGDWLLGPGAYYVSPLYIYFLAVVFALTGADPLHARVVQIGLGAASVLLVAGAARRLYGERASVLAAALAAVTGVLVFAEILLLQSALDPFLAALALNLLARALVSGSSRGHALAGIAFGLLGLNRPNALLAVAAVGVVGLLFARTRRSVIQVAALALGAAVALAPVAIRNRVVAGEWIAVSSHGGLNFNIGNNPSADGAYQAPAGITPSIEGQSADMRRVAEAAAGRPLPESEVSGHFYGESFRWMRAQPGAAARLFVRKLALAFHSVELPLNYAYAYWSRDEPTLLRALVVGPWLLVPLGLAGLAVAGDADRRARLAWCAFIPAYAVATAVFFVTWRYRLPLVAALCVPAGAALDRAWSWAASRERPREWRAMSALLALGVALAFWPWRVDDGAAQERTERIVHLVAEGRGDEARALAERTASEHPDRGMFHYRVGRAWLDAGRHDVAAAELSKSLAAAPEQGEVHLAYAQALLRLGRAADAVPHLEKARAANAFPDVAGLELARALASLGRNGEARAAVAATPVLADTDVPTLGELGGAALALGDAPTAVRFFEEAVRRRPDDGGARESLGLALAQLGRDADAIAALETAARLAPSDPTVPYNLALLYARGGRIEDARREAERARRLDPRSPRATALLEQLARRYAAAEHRPAILRILRL